jgi:TM2 domain-containing membrane protein YozV
MGYIRVFRRVRIAPGLTLNLAKRGASLSVGVRGAHITMGRTGIRRTVGVPGTGVFYTSHQGWHSGVHTGEHFTHPASQPQAERSGKSNLLLLILCLLLGWLGIHRFYAGRMLTGLLMLLLLLSGYGAMILIPWWIVDLILIVSGRFYDRHGNRIRW